MSATASGPIVLSTSLSPIPGKIVENIRQGQFMEILSENIALFRQLQELGVQSAHE